MAFITKALIDRMENEAQVAALLVLLEDICERHGIPRTAVIAHADLAPTRKRDPGAHFPWATLAAAGFGRWPQGPLADPPPGFDPWIALRLVGYSLDDTTPPTNDTPSFSTNFLTLVSATSGLAWASS